MKPTLLLLPTLMKYLNKKILILVAILLPLLSYAQSGVIPLKQIQKGNASGKIIRMKDTVISWDSLSYLELKDLDFSGYVTPEQFGAKGDGATDNTAALQAMINSGKPVKFIRGLSYRTGPLRADTAGQAIDIGNATLILKDSQSAPILSLYGEGITVQGGIFDGNKGGGQQTANAWYDHASVSMLADNCTIRNAVSQNSAGIAFKGTNVNNCTVRDVLVKNYSVQGIFIETNSTGDTYGNRILNSIVYNYSNTGVGIYMKGSNSPFTYKQRGWQVSGNTVYGTDTPTTADVLITIRAVDGICIGNTTYGGDMGISADIASGSVISGNNIYDPTGPTGYCIEVCGGGNTISGNVLQGGKYGVTGSAMVGIPIDMERNTITGNTFIEQTEHAIYLTSSDSTHTGRYAVISNNNFKQSVKDMIRLRGYTEGAVISGNSFQGSGSGVSGNYAVFTDGMNNGLLFTGNRLKALQRGIVSYNTTGDSIRNFTVSENNYSDDVASLFTLTGAAVFGNGNVLVKDNFNASGYESNQYLDRGRNVYTRIYNGNPEGAISAGIGSSVIRKSGGVGSTLSIKESNDGGNTGWSDVITKAYVSAQGYARLIDTQTVIAGKGYLNPRIVYGVNETASGILSSNYDSLKKSGFYYVSGGPGVLTQSYLLHMQYPYDNTTAWELIKPYSGKALYWRHRPVSGSYTTPERILDSTYADARFAIKIGGSQMVDFGNVTAGSDLAAGSTLTLSGAVVGDFIQVSGPYNAGLSYFAVVTGVDTVQIYARNVTASDIDPPSGTFKVFVLR